MFFNYIKITIYVYFIIKANFKHALPRWRGMKWLIMAHYEIFCSEIFSAFLKKDQKEDKNARFFYNKIIIVYFRLNRVVTVIIQIYDL